MCPLYHCTKQIFLSQTDAFLHFPYFFPCWLWVQSISWEQLGQKQLWQDLTQPVTLWEEWEQNQILCHSLERNSDTSDGN